MNADTLAGWLIILAPIFLTGAGMVGAALVRNYRPARELSIGGADYVQAVADAADFAERYGATNGVPGFQKFAVAVKQMDKWLDDQGIHGDARRITMERVKADIELMRARLFPKAPAA